LHSAVGRNEKARWFRAMVSISLEPQA